jgi:elongation factor G
VTCGSAFRNRGVQAVLDAVIEYLPSPKDKPPVTGVLPGGQVGQRVASDDEPFAALAFKVATDPVVGNLTYFRVYSGVLRSGDAVFNAGRNQRESAGRLLQMHANERQEISEVRAGDIAAASGFTNVTTGDTLADEKSPIALEKIEFPEPVISMALEPRTAEDQEKMVVALAVLAGEDPSIRVGTDAETAQTIISGMGELHLEIIVARLRREFGVDAKVGRPKVAYRETIRRPVEQEGRFVRQAGGRGQYGHVRLRMEPLAAGCGYQFVNSAAPGAIPQAFIPAIEEAVREEVGGGALYGFPLVDLRVTLLDGSSHETDATEAAFRIAASAAFKEGCRKAAPVLLEPVMRVEVSTPDQFVGDINGDLSRRRGVLQGVDESSVGRLIRAEVPLAEMFGYATSLRSMTQGRATFSMEFVRYIEVPSTLAAALARKE